MQAIERRTAVPTDIDPIRDYLNEIAQIPLLSPGEQRALGMRAKQIRGSLPEGIRAIPEEKTSVEERGLYQELRGIERRLTESNLRLVPTVLRRYYPRRLSNDTTLDLIQAGNIGVMRAAETFDPEKGAFSTHAAFWIRSRVNDAVRAKRVIAIPANVLSALGRSFEDEGNEGPRQEVLRMTPISLDQEREGKDWETTLADSVRSSEDPETEALQSVFAQEIRENVFRVISCFPKLQRQTIVLRYGLLNGKPLTLEQVGEIIKRTPEGVRRIEKIALRRLRHDPELPKFLNW